MADNTPETADNGRTSQQPRARVPVSDDERARMRQLATEGWSVRAIATELGRAADTVSKQVRDVSNSRRAQTAKATEAKSLDVAERRAKLMESTLQAIGGALGRWAKVAPEDHRGSSDEAKAFSALTQGYAKLDERHTRAQGGQDMAAVDAWLAAMTGGAPLGDDEVDS